MSGCNSPPLLEPCPLIFNQMAVSVSPFWTTDVRTVSPCWTNRTRSMVPESALELLGGIPTVTDDITRLMREDIKKSISRRQLMSLPG